MASETIVAVFGTAAEAEATAAELRTAGISSSAIEIHKEAYHAGGQDADLVEPATEGRSGFWGWLLGEEGYQDEQTMYDRTIASGGAVLSVIVTDADAQKVYAIIETHHPADVDERAAAISEPSATRSAAIAVSASTAPLAAAPSQKAGSASVDKGAETIALAEEQMNVGKRLVERGTSRIRRFVVERPVEEQIRLRTERVLVERRPVGSDTKVPADAFTDKVIEVRETTEEAVIGKTARVFEEVVVGKDVSERVETVRDTVRREDVEITQATGVGEATPSRPTVSPKV